MAFGSLRAMHLVHPPRLGRLDGLDDVLHHLDALERIPAGGRLAGEHHRVGALAHGRRDVRDLRARRHRRQDHRLEQMRGDDDRLAVDEAQIDDARLHEREGVIVDLDAEVAPGHHDGVGNLDDVCEVADSRSDPRSWRRCGRASPGDRAAPAAPGCRRARRTKDSAKKSQPASTPTRMSRSSFSVSDGRLTSTPGRLMCRREPSRPGVVTRQRRDVSFFSTTSMRMSPLSTSTVAPTAMSRGKPGVVDVDAAKTGRRAGRCRTRTGRPPRDRSDR